MSRAEAIESMKKGNKVTHPYFTNDEFIYLDEFHHIIDENGLDLGTISEFFSIRQSMTDNWSIKQ